MKVFSVFWNYNCHKIKQSIVQYVFIILSMVLAVGLALSIPQVIFDMDYVLNQQADEINGGDVRVEASYVSESFEQKLNSLIETKEISSYSKTDVYNGSIEIGENQIYSDLLLGEYDLASSEAIISSGIAEKASLNVGDTFTIQNCEYKVLAIEEIAKGVPIQSQYMGYIKVNNFEYEHEAVSYNTLYFLTTNKPEQVVSDLKEESNYTYLSVTDQKNTIQEQINSSVLMLNLIQTMCFLLTLFCVLSSIFMLLEKRKRDIAIMKINGIASGSISMAFFWEFIILTIFSVFSGAFISGFLTRFLLKTSGFFALGQIPVEENSKIVMFGILLLFLGYMIYIFLMCFSIRFKKPLAELRGERIEKNNGIRKVIVCSILFTAVFLFLYAIYVGWSSALVSSIVIVLFLLLFFLICKLCISIFCMLKNVSTEFNYVLNKIKQRKTSVALTIVSMVFMGWFVLLGFILPKTISASYTDSYQNTLEYNYMIYVNDEESQNNLENNKSIKYSKLYMENGVAELQEEKKSAVCVAEILQEEYCLKYAISEGEDLFEGSLEEVVISKEYAKQNQLLLGDEITLFLGEHEYHWRIKGLYNSAEINSNTILRAITDKSEIFQQHKVAYIVKAPSKEFFDELKEAMLMDLNVVGEAMTIVFENYLKLFRLLCFVCIIVAIVFSTNIVWINIQNDHRESVIVQALGVGRKFLYYAAVLESGFMVLLSTVLAFAAYAFTANIIVNAIFGIEAMIRYKDIFLLLGLIFIINVFVYTKKFTEIYFHAADHDCLRAEE